MTADSSVRSAFDALFGGEENMSTVERAVSVGVGLAMAAGGLELLVVEQAWARREKGDEVPGLVVVARR